MNDPNKILNPKTNRYVLKTGKIGKQLLALPKKQEKLKNKITINELKTIWYELYNIAETKELIKFSTTNNILKENDSNLLDIKFSKTEKIIGINGKGTFVLRKLSDIALSNGENTMIYLPKNFTGKTFSKPLWNVKHGYMYYINDVNIKNITILSFILNNINTKYNTYKLSDSPIQQQKTDGIIGIDIPYDEPEWLSKLIPSNKLSNPIINKSGQFIFSKCSITTKTIEYSTTFLNSKLDKFKNIYPNYINITNTNVISKKLNDFIESKYTIGLIAYDKHARIIFKNNTNLHIIDPWKQTADTGTKNLIKLIPTLSFIKRKAEQTTEGSCVAISYARSLYLADKGFDSIYEPIPFDYIVLTSRVISKFRNKK